MKYSYKGKVNQDEIGFFIDIPFNIWEICEKEGNVPAKVKVGTTGFVGAAKRERRSRN